MNMPAPEDDLDAKPMSFMNPQTGEWVYVDDISVMTTLQDQGIINRGKTVNPGGLMAKLGMDADEYGFIGQISKLPEETRARFEKTNNSQNVSYKDIVGLAQTQQSRFTDAVKVSTMPEDADVMGNR
jgi:hypothetical protein